jgi:hypothetical protein
MLSTKLNAGPLPTLDPADVIGIFAAAEQLTIVVEDIQRDRQPYERLVDLAMVRMLGAANPSG